MCNYVRVGLNTNQTRRFLLIFQFSKSIAHNAESHNRAQNVYNNYYVSNEMLVDVATSNDLVSYL